MAIQGGVLSDAPSVEKHTKGSKRKSSPGGDRRRKGRRHDEEEHGNVQGEEAGDQETEDTAAAPNAEGNAPDQDGAPEKIGSADDSAEHVEQEDAAGTSEPSTEKQMPAATETRPDSSRPPGKDAQATPDRRGASSETKKRLYGKRTYPPPRTNPAHPLALSQLLRGGRAQSPSEQTGRSPGSLRATGLQRTARVPPLHVKRRSPPPPRPKIPKNEDKKAEKEEGESAEENRGEEPPSDYPFVDYDVEEGFL